MPRKIYIIGQARGYANWMEGEFVDTMEEADLVVFTGGEDVSPELYKEPKHKLTQNNKARDMHEVMEWGLAQRLGKHVIGICRGSQFCCVMSGGRLVQHQENPHYRHEIFVADPRWDGTRGMMQVSTVDITSTHHQAMFPYDMSEDEYKLYGWTRNISRTHQDGIGQEMLRDGLPEAEIVYFPKTKALGIQGHPEFMDEKKYPETFEYLHKLLDDHLNDKL